MANIFIDPSAASNGNGTLQSPYNTLVGLAWVAGNSYLIKRNTSWTGSFTVGTAGTATAPIIISTWANADGTDDTTQARPILNLSQTIGTLNGAKDYVKYYNLNIRSTLTVGNDKTAVWLGHNSGIYNTIIAGNCGAVGIWGKSNVEVVGCELSGITHGTANNNNVVLIGSDNMMNNVKISSCKITHMQGGGVLSNGITAGTNSIAYDLTNLVIENCTVAPPGIQRSTNQGGMGIRLSRCPGAVLKNNNVTGMQAGVFINGAGKDISGVLISGGSYSNNYHYGIHASTNTHGFIIEYVTTDDNGTDQYQSNGPLKAYGRGIELSSAAGQGMCSDHIVRFCSGQRNRNYGGPADNGSEGVWLGIDDGTMNVTVYGCYAANNEGNGIQVYGAGFADTGGHKISGNILVNNSTNAVLSRRTGGTSPSLFAAHIACSQTVGSTTIINNNTMIGGKVGISEGGCNNITKANNLFQDVQFGIVGATYGSFNNTFYSNAVPMQKYGKFDGTTGTWRLLPVAYSGNSDLTN